MKLTHQCIITILQNHGGQLTTPQVLEFAALYPDLCTGCSSGTQIITAAMELVDQGALQRVIQKGGFLWILK